MEQVFQISPLLRAQLTDEGHNLTIFCDQLDDYDLYHRDGSGDWELAYDSLSNKDDEANSATFWDRPDFQEWAQKL